MRRFNLRGCVKGGIVMGHEGIRRGGKEGWRFAGFGGGLVVIGGTVCYEVGSMRLGGHRGMKIA